MKICGFLIGVLLSNVAGAVASPERVSSDGIEQPAGTAETLWALIEIPMGSANKYELDEGTGWIVLDRVLSMPMVYPANYGMFPQTLTGDGETLDLLLLSRFPLHPGVLVSVRPIGVLRMSDGGDEDSKILCVPASSVDPTYAAIHSASDLAPLELQRLEGFFRVYKDLPTGGEGVNLSGWGTVDEAREIVRHARHHWAMAQRNSGRTAPVESSGQDHGHP
jgi:inorganic pyrophosphatase